MLKYRSSNHIKRATETRQRPVAPFSSRNRGADTMPDHTLPLFSLQHKAIPLTQGMSAIVDASDFALLSQFKWCAKTDWHTWYAVRKERVSEGKFRLVYMHRFILGVEPGVQVDHCDGNGLNNIRANLRPVTSQQNNFNRAAKINNISGYKGVGWHKSSGKWQARIYLDGKPIYLGLFAAAEEAAIAYDTAARELHGEFARCNFSEGEVKP